MYAVEIYVPATHITEVQDEGDGILIVTVTGGESFELTEEAFAALTGREWADSI